MVIEKLKGDAFSPLDILEMDISVHLFRPIDEDIEEIELSDSDIKSIELAVTSGPHWQLNPTCRIFIDKNNVFNYRKEDLIDHVLFDAEITTEEIDNHQNVVIITYSVELLLVNARTLPDELILKSEQHVVHTPLGKISL